MRQLNEHPMELNLRLVTYRQKPLQEQASVPVLMIGLSAEFAMFCSDVKFPSDANYGFDSSFSLIGEELVVPATVDSRKQLPNGLFEYRLSFQFKEQEQFMSMYRLTADLEKHLKSDPNYSNFKNMAIWELWMKRQNPAQSLT